MIVVSFALALVLGLLSLLCSTFILVYILVPILPPHVLSKRIAARKTTWDQLSAAHRAIVWLTLFDIVALIVFVAQISYQSQQTSSSSENFNSFDSASHGGSAARFWISLTARQTTLLVVLTLTLLHVRLARPVSFGSKHVFLWLPSICIVLIGTISAGVLADFGYKALFPALGVYLSIITLLATTLLGSLALTIWRIKQRLQTGKDASDTDSWLEFSSQKRRQSFATDDVEALKDGSSWVTSTNGSDRRSMSPWSFTTTNTVNSTMTRSMRSISTRHRSRQSIPTSLRSQLAGSIYSEADGNPDDVPPVPPLPPLYRSLAYDSRQPRTARRVRDRPRPPREGSTDSWLTSVSDSRDTMSSFSFPTARTRSQKRNSSRSAVNVGLKELVLPTITATTTLHPSVPPPVPPKAADQSNGTENSAFYSLDLIKPSSNRQMTLTRLIGWLAVIWIPYLLSMPYILLVKPNHNHISSAPGILMIISVTVSSPLLAIILMLKTPFHKPSRVLPTLPFKSGSNVVGEHRPHYIPSHFRAHSLHNLDTRIYRHGASSYTVVEGRRSCDVWVEKGQAVDIPSKVGRMASLLTPHPKLSVLPSPNKAITNVSNSTGLTFDSRNLTLLTTSSREVSQKGFEIDQTSQQTPINAQGDHDVGLNVQTDAQDGQAPSGQHKGKNRLALVKSLPYSPPNFKMPRFTVASRAVSMPTSKVNLSPSQRSDQSDNSNAIDELPAVILPILVPGLVVGESQPIEKIRLPEEPPSQVSSDLFERDIKDNITESRSRSMRSLRSVGSFRDLRGKKSFPRSLSLHAPDGHSTPYQRGVKHDISDDPPPLPAARNPDLDLDHTNVEPVPNSFNTETLPHSLQATITVPSDEDDLTRKMESLIQALGSPGVTCPLNTTPYASVVGLKSKKVEQGTSSILFPTDPETSPVKPLDLGRTGVTRNRAKSHRFSPFKRSPKELFIPKEQGVGQGRTQMRLHDAKTRQSKSSSRIPKFKLKGNTHTQSEPLGFRYWPDNQAAPPPPPSGYLPVIERLSGLFPDEANPINNVKNPKDASKLAEVARPNVQECSTQSSASIRSSKSSKSSQSSRKVSSKTTSNLSGVSHHSVSPTRTMVPAGIFKAKKVDMLKAYKEDNRIASKLNRSRKEAVISMSDTAKARNLLIHNQQLPRVVVHPPSIGPTPFQDSNSNSNEESNSDFLSRQCI